MECNNDTGIMKGVIVKIECLSTRVGLAIVHSSRLHSFYLDQRQQSEDMMTKLKLRSSLWSQFSLVIPWRFECRDRLPINCKQLKFLHRLSMHKDMPIIRQTAIQSASATYSGLPDTSCQCLHESCLTFWTSLIGLPGQGQTLNQSVTIIAKKD